MSERLEDIAQAMVAPNKGILAADESTGTMKKRLDSIGVECTGDNRRDYREMMFRTPVMAEHISGVILFDETIRQSAADGTPMVDIIKAAGTIPGIKVDTGAHALAGAAGEKVTEGLDGLRDRLNEYYTLGARFAKWRAVIAIGDTIPSQYCQNANAHALARYAALCQEAGLVPIVEPEVLMDGPHSLDDHFAATTLALQALYAQLAEQRVVLEGTILKPNMTLSGTECATQAGVEEVAARTVECLKANVPEAVPGICFLSGGQSDIDATAHLNAMNALGGLPWRLSYSYGRALQAAPLKAWGGRAENVAAAQAAFTHRARMNGAATAGAWSDEMENAG
ncbi:MAG: fructose-bisphosphate aldolase class I [Proteobacteria bacterium]|nr:fructose-bisphosphate aldolase class I [Pseudomonadota bacterium]